MENNRFVKLEKAYNFREIGNLDTFDGKKLLPGILYRSDELSKLTLNDRKIFSRLNIKLIVDLRGIKEREKKLDNIPTGLKIQVENIPIDHSNQDLKQIHFYYFLINKSKDFDFEKYIKDHYFGTAFESTAQIKEILTLLSDEKNLPALLHCTVGKDRTGFMAAIIQLLAGIPRSVVMEEYLATNNFIGKRTAQIIRAIRILSLFRVSAKQIQPLLEVRPEYLGNVLDEIFNRFGTIENYLISCCGMEKNIVMKLKNLITG